MKNRKFWNWINQADENAPAERVLELYGTIAEESWFDDDITPAMFKDELFSGEGRPDHCLDQFTRRRLYRGKPDLHHAHGL